MIYKGNLFGFLEDTVKICNVKRAPFAIAQAKIIFCDYSRYSVIGLRFTDSDLNHTGIYLYSKGGNYDLLDF